MMSDFLSREEEFLKLNEELDKKTQSALEKGDESSEPASPVVGSVVSSRRASSEVERINLKASSKISTIKNSSLPRPASGNQGNKSPQNSRIVSPTSRTSKVGNDSRTSSRLQASSRITSPKLDNNSISSKTSEKPPFKAKIWTAKAYTVPRKSRDVANSPSKRSVTAKEKQLRNINSKLDKTAKMALDDVKENIEKPKITVNQRPPSRYAYNPKNVRSPRNVQSPKSVHSPRSVLSPRSVQSPRNTPTPRNTPSPQISLQEETNEKPSSSLPKKTGKIMTETYRNKNFKESPSTEALNLQFPGETKDNLTGRSDQTSKTKRESATSSIKKPLRQLAAVVEKVNKKTLSTDGLIKYLKSKISIIEVELEDNMNELRKKTDELHSSYEAQKKLETQRDHAISKNNALTEQLSKMEEKLQAVERKLHDREFDHSATTREVETLRREVRVITQANNNLEKRLYKANEELENMRNSMTSMREAERDQKEAERQEKEMQDKQVKTLKKQRSELLTAYKKQLYLIDNLRRQNICMEQAKMLSFGEKEFTKVLGWNAQN